MRIKVIGDGKAARELRHLVSHDKTLSLVNVLAKVSVEFRDGDDEDPALLLGPRISDVELMIVGYAWLVLGGKSLRLEHGGVTGENSVIAETNPRDDEQSALLPKAIYRALLDYAEGSR